MASISIEDQQMLTNNPLQRIWRCWFCSVCAQIVITQGRHFYTINLPDNFPVIRTVSSNSHIFAWLCGNNESVTDEYTVESDNICYTVQLKEKSHKLSDSERIGNRAVKKKEYMKTG